MDIGYETRACCRILLSSGHRCIKTGAAAAAAAVAAAADDDASSLFIATSHLGLLLNNMGRLVFLLF